MEGYPSGQRGQTVNLLPQASLVRIQPPPPSKRINGAGVAQSVEQPTCNRQVAGSSPIASSI